MATLGPLGMFRSMFPNKEKQIPIKEAEDNNSKEEVISDIADKQNVENDNPELTNTTYGNTYKHNQYGWNHMTIEELKALLETENKKLEEKREKQVEHNTNKEEKDTKHYDDYNNLTENTDVTFKNGYNSKTWEVENEQIGYRKCYRHISDLEQYIKHREQSNGGKSRRKKKRTKKSKKSKKSKRKRSRKARK